MRPSTTGERFAALRAVSELASCSDREVWSLVAYADEVGLDAGDQVAREGRFCTEFVVVMEGALRARSVLIGPGGSLGWHALWERSTNPANVVVEADARLLVMSHDQFRAVKALVGPGLMGTLEPCRRSPSSELEVQSSLAS